MSGNKLSQLRDQMVVQPREAPPLINWLPADPYLNSQNPAVQMSTNVQRAYSQPVDPAQEMQQLKSDLRWRSWNTRRGQGQALDNLQNNAALRKQIETLLRGK